MCQPAAAAKPTIRMVVHDGAGCLTEYFGEHAIIWIGGRIEVVERDTLDQQRLSFVLRTVAHRGPVVAGSQTHQEGSVGTDRLVKRRYHAFRAPLDLSDGAH